ncbi:DUF317 domain-containing protein [Streptomyces albus]|uniref:DUF317 domain-containing protein n=1 Tax=Streptomyces albus TaxID=1888 RepID=UPI003F1A3B85
MPGTVPVDFVAPRHLAGGGDPTWVTVPLHRACGWSHGHDPLTPRVLLSSPDQKTLLRLEPDPEGRWWEIRHTGGAGHKPWMATFDGHTPVEAIAAFTDALTDPSAATGDTDPYEPLRQTGWEPAGRGDGLVSPDGTAHVEHLVEETTDCWFATTRPDTDHAPHWQAYFNGDTPLHLVTAFSRALCDETPVMRRNPLMRASARTCPLITRQPREVPAIEVAFALENRVRQLTAQHTGPPAPAPPHHRRPKNRRTR